MKYFELVVGGVIAVLAVKASLLVMAEANMAWPPVNFTSSWPQWLVFISLVYAFCAATNYLLALLKCLLRAKT